MRFLRGCTSLILLLILAFFLAGVASSNDWESDPSSPISAGALGKVILIPICIVIGLVLFKVAGPLFGGTRFSARNPKYQQQARSKISNNRYRMGSALPAAYGVATLGLVVLLFGISTGDTSKVKTGVVMGLVALFIRGRLQSERRAAQAIGARTLSDDVADGFDFAGQFIVGTVQFAATSAIKGGKKLATKVRDALEEGPSTTAARQAHGGQNWNLAALKTDEEVASLLVEMIERIRATFGPQLDVLSSSRTASKFPPMSRPVSSGRQLLVDAFAGRTSNRGQAKSFVNRAIESFDRGAVTPDGEEWFIDGIVVGRGHACMWGGIARTLAHLQSATPFDGDATKADSWFGTATLIFLQTGEFTMAARTLQEWAESRRLHNDKQMADLLNFVAVGIFSSGEIDDRAQNAASRIGETGPSPVDTSFFLGRPPTQSEVAMLTTVLGGRNTQEFYNQMK